MPRGDYKAEIIARVYGKYQNALEQSNAVDFDDMLLYTYQLLHDRPEIRERYGKRFEQILVDEFQDTNAAQYQLLRKLASVHKGLFAVGDEDQSIYRWRGADYRNILQFEKDYPDCKKILLEQNYRSTQNILNAARAGKKALAICTISDLLTTKAEVSAEERQHAFTDMMRIALEIAEA